MPASLLGLRSNIEGLNIEGLNNRKFCLIEMNTIQTEEEGTLKGPRKLLENAIFCKITLDRPDATKKVVSV